MHGRLPLLLALCAAPLSVAVLLVAFSGRNHHASAAAGDISITALSCDSSPEFVRLENFGNETQPLDGFRLQSDPVSSQDYDLSAKVAWIDPGQTIELQSGSGAAQDPQSGIYKLTGNPIFRNGDPTDFARLARPDATSQQVNCGSTPSTPTPTPSPTPSPSPSPIPSPTGGPPVNGSLLGDVDCSQVVDAVDALFVLRLVAHFQPVAPCIKAGDVDCNSVTDSVDALGTLRFTAHLPPLLSGPNCPGLGTQFGLACGVERWRVKTLSDPAASSVNFAPQTATVSDLRTLPRPQTLPELIRVAPTELTVFRVQASVQKAALEDDQDIHLVIADPSNPAETMIIEFADPTCSGAIASAKAEDMAAARQAFITLFGEPTPSFQSITGTVEITGVGFFDFLHGQEGVAPNGIELHPVLSITAQ